MGIQLDTKKLKKSSVDTKKVKKMMLDTEKIWSGSSKFIGTMNKRSILVSEDGINWEVNQVDAVASYMGFCQITYGNGMFIMSATYSSSSKNRLLYSTDGVTWTVISPMNGYTVNGLAYGNGKFI